MDDFTEESAFYLKEIFKSVNEAAEELAADILDNIENEEFDLDKVVEEKTDKYFPESIDSTS